MKRTELLKYFGYSQELLDFLMVDDSEEPNSTPSQNPESVFIYSDEDNPLTIDADGKLEGGKNINFPEITDLSEDSINQINKYLKHPLSLSNTHNPPKDEPKDKHNIETTNHEEQNATATNQPQRTTEINGVDLMPMFELIKLSKKIRELEKQNEAAPEVDGIELWNPNIVTNLPPEDSCGEIIAAPDTIHVKKIQ